MLCFHLVQDSRFRGEVAVSPPFFIGVMPQSVFLVTSHSYDTREGIVSHVWWQILRLSPHLFWLGLFTHRVFSSAQDDDTRGRMVSQAGGFAAFLEDGLLVSQPSPLGNAIKLSGRTFLAPHRGSSPKGRGGYVAALHESVGISIASDYST